MYNITYGSKYSRLDQVKFDSELFQGFQALTGCKLQKCAIANLYLITYINITTKFCF